MRARRASCLARGTGAAVPLLLAALAALALPVLAWAHDGVSALRVSRQQAGPYAITVFTGPDPLPTGEVDVSVLVEGQAEGDVVLDARVTVEATPLGHDGAGGIFEATHEEAANKLFYAAHLPLERAGRWRLDVRVEGARGQGSVSFEVETREAGLFDHPLISVAVVLGLALALLWWLRGAGTRRSRPVRAARPVEARQRRARSS
ncbi:MAG TPA: hypothetical protein VIN09_15075 [Chloroflexota bacterium]